MGRQRGFTVIELMVVSAIVGILFATAMPLYHTWTQRAYGTEAALMMKQIMDGEIMYYLAHDEFFPEGDGTSYSVFSDGTANPGDAFARINEALKVAIPTGHYLDYTIQNSGLFCVVQIDAPFPLFKDDQRSLWAVIDTEGKVQYVSAAELAVLLGG
jgi:prepilin-type N-terminal cleavage/methylation domain-containing protein